jgi:lipoprotein-anchoring transpeptidase ErfK/SrfK
MELHLWPVELTRGRALRGVVLLTMLLILTACAQAVPQVSPPAGGPLPWDKPVVLSATNGRISSVSVQGSPRPVTGTISPNGRTWTSQGLLTPGTTYTAHVRLRAGGTTVSREVHFTTGPAERVLHPEFFTGPDEVVGVGTALVVRFDQPVNDKAAVEGAMKVAPSTPVEGAWHWFSPTEVHYRPQQYWPAHTKIHVGVAFTGVYAGDGVWGDREHDFTFAIGDSHLSVVDASAHTVTVYNNGTPVRTLPTSLGKPAFQTRNGIYRALEKHQSVHMTSCSAAITCEKGSSNYYDLTVYWNVRLTNSGTFVHAAPWTVAEQGSENVSHGCVNLSTSDATWFYNFTQLDDVVQVINSTRGPQDLVRAGDPGMADWNISWLEWLAGSATRGGGPH